MKRITLSLILIAGGAMLTACTDSADATTAQLDVAKEQVRRGQYLVTVGGCNDCHTPMKMGAKGPEPDMSRMLSGHPQDYVVRASNNPEWLMNVAPTGTAFAGPWGVSFARNLTPDQVTGIGIWTEAQFIKTIRSGRHWGVSRPILPPMPWFNYAKMTDADLKAVYAYLRTIPAVRNEVPDAILAPPPQQAAKS
ncbi:MAG TPA: c-type cytochrome [Thermoanaerobaculia bacterium]|jgi:mono/diheme cytochrome c family protein